jgi:hypothetical protein
MISAITSVAFESRRAAERSTRLPLSPSLDVRAARDAYLDENGFDLSSYTAATFEVEAFGRRFEAKNTADRKWALPLHDLHHAATGYGTDLVGEAEIGAFELLGGCRTPIVYALNLAAVKIGLLVAPLRTLRAFWVARGAKALFRQEIDYDALLGSSLGDLRARLGLPRRLHDAEEAKAARPLPSAPPIAGARLAICLALAAVAIASGAAAITHRGTFAIVVTALGVALAAFTLAARRGSLGTRALAGYAAVGFGAASIASGIGLIQGAIGAAVALLFLAILARR